MEAVILAAGRGERLYPLTKDLPKPMIKVLGKPLLHHTIDILKSHGIKKIIIVVGYKDEVIKDYFRDGKGFGLTISYVTQNNNPGTANAVKLVKNHINEDKFLLVYGDQLFNPKIVGEILMKKDFYDGVMCCEKIGFNHFGGWIEIKNDNVIGIKEGFGSENKLYSQGLFIIPKEIFEGINKIEISQRGELELPDAIRFLIENGKKFGYILIKNGMINVTYENDIKIAEDLIKSFN